MTEQTLERVGKEAAARFLYRRGYEIVARDWRCVAGTADIVARDGDAVVFAMVEVVEDPNEGLSAVVSIDGATRGRWERIAALFLRDYDAIDVPVRFDVVSVLAIDDDRALVRQDVNAWQRESRD